MARMKTTRLKTQGETVADELARDEEFRREWERLSLARAVAAKVITFRAHNGLSQRDLAKVLGMTQPQVARLEGGEHEPAQSTLIRLAGALGMEFTINIAPASRAPRLLTKRASDSATRISHDHAVVRFTAI